MNEKKRDWKLFLEDILEGIDRITRYVSRFSFEKFAEDEKTIDAVIRNLEVIGEASKNIPDEIRNKYHEIPWKSIVGLRNVMVHEYFGLDLENIWKIIREDLPPLKGKIKEILERRKP